MSLRRTLFVDVILPLAVPNRYTYRVPFEWNDAVIVGQRVVVQFGKSKLYTALIREIHEQAPAKYEARYIEAVLDAAPIVNETQFRFWEWLANYYLCYAGEVMNAALPGGLKLNSESKVILNQSIEAEERAKVDLSDKEFLIIEALQTVPSLSLEEISAIVQLKGIQPLIKSLLTKGLIYTYEEVKEKYKTLKVPYLKLSEEYFENETKLQQLFTQLEKKAFRQLQALISYLDRSKKQNSENELLLGWISKKEILAHTDAAALNALLKKGVFIQQEFETARLQFESTEKGSKTLNELQEKACEEIKQAFEKKDVCLLHGVTGSGKTEIYCRLMEEVIALGKQVLYLVPEIALTTQLIYRIQYYFGDKAGVYHSKFSENERVEIWNSLLERSAGEPILNEKKIQIVLGARSAVFLPFSKLGLIIIDEEHDGSYKQHDPAPRYHARDSAIYLAHLHGAKVLMGSATPAIESYYNALQGKYCLVELTQRYGIASLPEIEVADGTKQDVKAMNNYLFSPKLKEEITGALERKEQVILFQNRRGFAPYTECKVCSWVPRCVQCDVSLIYHKASNKLSCHYCGYTITPPASCSACGSNDLRHKGYGTEKIEEELEINFPQAKIARMDLDSTRSKYAYRQLINDFESGEIDILVGTQMVTKGLDFDHVSLVGVINADQMLNFPDYRAFERSYQLMAQVSGRAGRKNKKGKVIIQTNQPRHKIIQQVIDNNYKEFYQFQLTDREHFNYPPFCRIIEMQFVSGDIDLLNYAAEQMAENLEGSFPGAVLGPEFPIIARIKNEYYKHILIKIHREWSSQKVRESLWHHIKKFREDQAFRKVKIKIDADPQ